MFRRRRSISFLLALILFPGIALILILHIPARSTSAPAKENDSASQFAKREEAYRANNLGVALLERYKPKEAAESFTRALQIRPDLLLARINLSIALYYLPDADGARREAEKALAQDGNAPQPHYLLGLIARAQNRFDDALAEFREVLKIDPADVATNVNVGQIYVQQKKYTEAINAFRAAIAAEAYNQTALYNLGILLVRTGQKEEGQRLLQKFQQFRQNGAGTTIGANYLEGGRYAEAVISTGIERDLVDKKTPDVTFVDATESFMPPQARKAGRNQTPRTLYKLPSLIEADKFNEQKRDELVRAFAGGVMLFDFDGDGTLDLLDLGPDAPRLYQNVGGKFIDASEHCGALCEAKEGINIGAVAGDYDNDGRPDVLVLRYGPQTLSLYHNDGNGHFSEVTKSAGIPTYPYLTVSAAFVDVDHDGDLDIFVGGLIDFNKPFKRHESGRAVSFPDGFAGAPNLLLRNNGNGTFSDITAAAKVEGACAHAIAVVPTDYDNNRDVDLLVVNYGAPPALYRNLRDGTFRDAAHETGLDAPVKAFGKLSENHWQVNSALVGDFNKDGFPDFAFLYNDGSVVFAYSDGKGRFNLEGYPWIFQVGVPATNAAQLIDYDNDGLLDIVELKGDGIHVIRNEGHKWRRIGSPKQDNLSDNANPLLAMTVTGRTLASGDLEGDGDIDLVFRSAKGALAVARNEGGNRNHSIKVNLHGRVSNRSGVEAKVEMRAGSLWQKLETYAAYPAPAPADVIFGLGKRDKADAVRVLWPAGIVQAETDFPASAAVGAGKPAPSFITLNITELDLKPSSCPYLFAWNGERFEFITDFMGGGEMGYLEEPGRYNKPQPVEYVRIRGDQLKEKDGRYELRVTNELEEALFVDRLQLLVVTHPQGAEVYPNEGMSDPPKRFRLFITHNARPPLSAFDDKGKDMLDLVSRLDRRWPDNFELDRIRGYAEEHSLTLKLSESNLLLLTGWTDYAWSSDNLAAAHSGKTMKPPALQVKDKKGSWRTVIKDIGIPVGRPQTVTVDLTGKFLSADREVRIVTNMRIYWDQILLAASDENSPAQITRLDPVRADLHWRGFSMETTPDGREPFGYDYQRVLFTSPWKTMTGRYTREGDVRELLLRSDDMFVICRPGDEISLSFDARALPALPAGWTRTFLLYADGFSKEMDINSASPDQVAPLPFHGMSRYPYSWPEHYPGDAKHREYMQKYNTRVVASQVLGIDGEIGRR